MSDYRIVHNEQTDQYRVERRGWAGWVFVRDPASNDYATFSSFEDARQFMCRRRRRDTDTRRWKTVSICSRHRLVD